MKPTPAIRIPDIEDRPTQDALLALAQRLADVSDNTREYVVAFQADLATISGLEAPILSVLEDSELTAVKVTPGSVTGASAATALSTSIYKRNAAGAGQKLLAYADRGSAGATPWSAFMPKSLAIVGGVPIRQGEVVTALLRADPSITIFTCTVTLHLRKVA